MKYRAKIAIVDASGNSITHTPFKEIVAWCEERFGPKTHDRWWPKEAYEIRFKDELDYGLFLLRWR